MIVTAKNNQQNKGVIKSSSTDSPNKKTDSEFIKCNDEIIFLFPYLVQKNWGGSKFSGLNYTADTSRKYGYAWFTNGGKSNNSILLNEGNTDFYDFFDANRTFFDGYDKDEYPIAMSLVDTVENLPVMVHPTKIYRRKYPNVIDKDKYIYIIKCAPKTEMIYGNTAQNPQEFMRFLNQMRFGRLLRRERVQPGKQIYITSGILYAYKAGMFVLQVENPGNDVFNFYNWDKDVDSPDSILNVREAVETTLVPFDRHLLYSVKKNKLQTERFSIKKIKTLFFFGFFNFEKARWLQCYVISGKGLLNWKYKIKAGDCFILNSQIKKIAILGRMEVLCTYVENSPNKNQGPQSWQRKL